MRNFKEFIDQKTRQARRELTLLHRVLKEMGLESYPLLDEQGGKEEPYVFVKATSKNLSFEGVRIYKVGDVIAYRIQKRKDTQPYGAAYPLDVETMYNDLIGEKMDEEKAGKRVMEAVGGEIQKFFAKCLKSEQRLLDVDGFSKIILKGQIDIAGAYNPMRF